MRKILLAVCLGLGITAQAQERTIKVVNLSEDVRMEQALGEERMSIDSVVVSGPMTEEDFTVLNDCSKYGRLSGINLLNSTVEGNKLPPRAFWWNYREEEIDDQLRYVTLPAGLEEIGDRAFYMRAHLTHVDFPGSLRRIGQYVFYNSFFKHFGDVDLPEGLEEVGNGAFYGCQRVRSISFPSTLKSVGRSAFTGVNSMETLTLPEGLEAAGASAFEDCLSLKEVHLPSCFRAASESMFAGCEIESINLPEGMEVIPSDFLLLNELEEVMLPEGLKEVGDRAFSRNPLLQVTIPASVEKIGVAAFSMRSHPLTLTCHRQTPPAISASAGDKEENHPFYGVNDKDVLYVPAGSKALYESAPYWCDFKTIVELSEDTGIESIDHSGLDKEHSEAVYDVMGRRMANGQLSKGVRLVSGKKFVVR